MKRRSVFYIPTMDLFEFLADTRAFVDGVLADPRVTMPAGLPGERVRRYRSPEYAKRIASGTRTSERQPQLADALREPAPAPRGRGPDRTRHGHVGVPGPLVSIEMDLYVNAGFTPVEAIRAATETAARSLGVEGPRHARGRAARRFSRPGRGSDERREERAGDRRHLEGWSTGEPALPDDPMSRSPIVRFPPIRSCGFDPSSRSSRLRRISSRTRSARCRKRRPAPSRSTRRPGRRAACAPGGILVGPLGRGRRRDRAAAGSRPALGDHAPERHDRVGGGALVASTIGARGGGS